jgi:hypothetical protein
MKKTNDILMERQNILVALRNGLIDVETAELLLDELFAGCCEDDATVVEEPLDGR